VPEDNSMSEHDYPESEQERRHRQIAERAYLRAASRDFKGGDPVADWLAAESEIDAQSTPSQRSPATRWRA
jgi:hypothetical protein